MIERYRHSIFNIVYFTFRTKIKIMCNYKNVNNIIIVLFWIQLNTTCLCCGFILINMINASKEKLNLLVVVVWTVSMCIAHSAKMTIGHPGLESPGIFRILPHHISTRLICSTARARMTKTAESACSTSSLGSTLSESLVGKRYPF